MMILKQIMALSSPPRFYQFCDILQKSCFILFLMGCAYGVIAGLFIAPADYQQGEGFRIIYVHVPCAVMSLFLYAFMAVCSAFYLIWRVKIADMLAYTIAPVGACFTLCALLTGAIWGKPMWGTWWIWDARLTSELILLFLYLGYMGLYQALYRHPAGAKICAILALVGIFDLPIIHYSVVWWNTLHQGATLLRLGKPAIESSMLAPLLGMIVGFCFYSIAILCVRVKTEILKRGLHSKWVGLLMK